MSRNDTAASAVWPPINPEMARPTRRLEDGRGIGAWNYMSAVMSHIWEEIRVSRSQEEEGKLEGRDADLSQEVNILVVGNQKD